MLEITIKDKQYPLSDTLRVAYVIQGMHNHAAYSDVFNSVAKMSIEKQVGLVYASFKVANPEEAKFITEQVFLAEVLDHYNLVKLMSLLKRIIAGITGERDDKEPTANPQEEVSDL